MNTNVKIFISIIGILILGTIAAVLLHAQEYAPLDPARYDALCDVA